VFTKKLASFFPYQFDTNVKRGRNKNTCILKEKGKQDSFLESSQEAKIFIALK